MLKQPKFEHECEECLYLGRFLKHDLYACRDPKIPNTITTVLARYGNEDWEYISGLEFAMLYGSLQFDSKSCSILFEALKRATARGFKPPAEYLKRGETQCPHQK